MEGSDQTTRRLPGRTPFLLLILALCISLALILVNATPLATEIGYGLFVIPSVLIVWAVIGIWSATLYVRCTRRRQWKKSVFPGVILLTSLLVAVSFPAFLQGCAYLGGTLRFAMTRSYYDQQVALLPTNGKPRLAFFSWGGMTWVSRAVVYDESDEVALPPGQQSATWKANPHLEELSCANWHAHRLSSHFYLVDFTC